MKRFGGKFQKVFLLAIFGVALGAMFFAGAANAQPPPPPQQAQCTQIPTIPTDFSCTGERNGALLGESFPGQLSPNLNKCVSVCTKGNGIVLRYGNLDQSTDWYCYGATKESTCTTDNGQTISVTAGRSDQPAQEMCSAKDVFGVLGCLLNSVLDIGVSFLGSVLAIIAVIMENIFGGVTTLYLWSINSSMSIPVTPSASGIVKIVEQGWNISRDIVNLLFVVILAFIGLATILRRQDFELQKMLPTFILIALLVNFSGVLVGFVVDIGNIITNFFLTHASSGFWSLNFPEKVFVLDPNAPASNIANISGSLARIVFYLIASLIYSVVSVLFFVRIFILWMLSILAPLAFFAYVLPATRKFWTQWWTQLIQWSLIGIPISFFMWLARLSLESNTNSLGVNASGVNIPGPGILASFLGPITALFLLYFGITLSMQLAPASAQGIIKFGQKAGLGAYGWAGRGLWQKTRDRILPQKTREAIDKMADTKNPNWGKNIFARGAAGLAGYATRAAGGALQSTLVKSEQADVEKAKGKAEKQNVVENLHDLRQAAGQAEKMGILDAMRKKGQLKDVMDANIVGEGNILKLDEVKSLYKKAYQTRNSDMVEGLEESFVANKDALKEFAAITDEITGRSLDEKNHTTNGLTREEEQKFKSFGQKIIAEADTADKVKQLQKGWWKDADLLEGFLTHGDGSQAAKHAETFGRDVVDAINRATEEKTKDWFIENNPKLVRYFAGNAAQGLGFSPKEGLETTKEIDTAMRMHREKQGAKKEELITLTAREKELNNLLRDASSERAALDSSYEQAIPGWREELIRIAARKAQLQAELKKPALAEEMEEEILPSLPRIEKGMPRDMTNLIHAGEAEVTNLKKYVENFKVLQENKKQLLDDLKKLQEESSSYSKDFEELAKKQDSDLTAQEATRKAFLRGQIESLNKQIKDQQEFTRTVEEKSSPLRETIEKSKGAVEKIREQIEPLEIAWKGEKREKERVKKYERMERKIK